MLDHQLFAATPTLLWDRGTATSILELAISNSTATRSLNIMTSYCQPRGMCFPARCLSSISAALLELIKITVIGTLDSKKQAHATEE